MSEYFNAQLDFFLFKNHSITVKSTIPNINHYLKIDFTESEDIKHFYLADDGIINLILTFLNSRDKYLVQGKISTITHTKYLLHEVVVKTKNVYLLNDTNSIK